MNEFTMRAEYERFCNDMSYAREKIGVSTDGELCPYDQRYFDHEHAEIVRETMEKLKVYETWNTTQQSGVPARFHECCFENYECHNSMEEKRKQSVIDFVMRENNDGVLLMTGDKGTGKTHLGTSAVRVTKGHYVTMEDLIYKVESSLNFKSPQTQEDVFKDYCTRKFLVIDEVGRSLKTDRETELLSYILRKRYDNQLPTIVISNLSKITLIKRLGAAVQDRLTEVAISIEFTGESYRILRRKISNAA